VGRETACSRELSVILDHESRNGSAPVLEALLGLRSGGGPREVTAAAERLLRQHAPWSLDLAGLAKGLVGAAGGPLDQRLFLASSLSADPPTFVELATREGITSRQAQKLVRRAEQRVRRCLPTAPPPLPWSVSALANRLGGLALVGQMEEELERLGACTAPAAPLFAWLAGPYYPVPGRPEWVATDPKAALARTATALAEDGGTRRLVDLEAELVDLQLTAASLMPWLRANGAIIVHDLVVSVNGTLGAVLERLLDAHGTPRTPDQLLADLAAGGRRLVPTALARVLRERRRFRLSASGKVALAAWPREEARSPQGKRPRPTATSAATAQCTEEVPPAERFWLWVRVDAEVIKGAEAPVPAGLIEALGLPALSRRTFSSRFGPVTLANEPPQATRGPLRAVALATGARPDDTVLLGFSRGGDVEVEVRRGVAGPGPTGMFTEEALYFQATASGGAR